MEKYLEIGEIVGTHGLRGVMRIKPLTDDITRFDKLKTVYIAEKKELVEFTIEGVQYNKNIVLLKLQGIDTIEVAEEYRNFYIKIDRKDSVKLEKDSYFIIDLIGCDVYDEEENLLGKVDDVFSTKSNDVYVVKDGLGKQVLLPAIKDVIEDVDIQNKKIVVKLLKGLY
ncbi:MAG: ribosome maturation factor RimM [Firmicutes bacterium]|nr:ribosome maturation factor RimM [Bacillota bacterium]